MQISSAIANSYTDSVLDSLHIQMVDNGLNNINLPDATTNFTKRRLGVSWHGEAVMYNGMLKGLETIHRTGDAIITINLEGVIVNVEVGIISILMTYDLNATFMNHGPRGSITGSLTHVTCDVQLCLAPGSDTVVLEKLTVKDIGSLKAKITGLGTVLNFAISSILGVVGNRVKWKVSNMLEDVIKNLLNEIIGKTPLPTSAVDVKKFILQQ